MEAPTPVQIGTPELPKLGSDTFFRLVNGWLRDCDQNHECHGSKGDVLPTRLIYVGTQAGDKLRLIETADEQVESKEYIALSHPWGDTKKYKPFSTLRQDPSGQGHELHLFKREIPYDWLPATFRDAVDCTRRLEKKYLWIDSICIVQGRDGDFAQEVNKIEDVFSGAYCVLAASRASHQHDGFIKSTDGIPKFRPAHDFVTFHDKQLNQPFYVCRTFDNFSKDVIEGSLNKRGWVLQERALARRTVYFTENQTYFECGQGVRCETMTKMHK